MSVFFMLSTILPVLTACDNNVLAVAALQNENRTVATVYKIKTDESDDKVECYRINASGRSPMTILKKNQLVDIVAIKDGLRRFEGELWLNIYPRLSHRPSCYVNINNLIPYG